MFARVNRMDAVKILLAMLAAVVLVVLNNTHVLGAAGDALSKGDEYFAKRGENHTDDWADAANALKAFEEYTLAYGADKSADTATKVLNAAYFYATYAEKDAAKQKEVLKKAIAIGEEALIKAPGHGPLNYQLGGCWGRWGEVNGIIASARKGVADRIKAHGEAALKADPNFAEGGAFRTLGRLHFKAPRIPLILSWPDKKEAINFLEKAIATGPSNLTNHLFLAESLYDAKRYEEAMKEVDIVLSAKVNPAKVVEDLRDKKDASLLKEKITTRMKK